MHSSVFLMLGVAVGCALNLPLPPSSHQRIQGKTPRQWVQLLTARPAEIKNAPPSLGPVLVPYLIDEIQRYENPFHGDLSYRLGALLYEHAPDAVVARLPEPVPRSDRRLNAVIVLGELGPFAQEAVPVLIPLLDYEALRSSAILTLQAIGPAARSAVPKLIQLLTDDPEPRLATALAILAPDDPDVIRALVEASRMGPGNVRREAVEALKICANKLASSLALLKREAAGMDIVR